MCTMAGNKYVGWCPQCGPREAVGLDEDGCCKTCGADAIGPGADQALKLLKDRDPVREPCPVCKGDGRLCPICFGEG